MLIVGDAVTAIGVACFFRTYLPIQSYDIFVKDVALRYNLNINKFKLIYDFSLLTVSVVLAFSLFGDVKTFDWTQIYKMSYHNLGLGTLITTIINSPFILVAGKLLDKLLGQEPIFIKAKAFLDRH
jgi:uncharacterized membrane protein YczE